MSYTVSAECHDACSISTITSFQQQKLPLQSPEEWCHLLFREGKYTDCVIMYLRLIMQSWCEVVTLLLASTPWCEGTDLTQKNGPTWGAVCRCPWSPWTRSWCIHRWHRSAPSQTAADPRWCPDPAPWHSGTCAESETMSVRNKRVLITSCLEEAVF